MKQNTRTPQRIPFRVEEVIAEERAKLAFPRCASGYPSWIVAAEELAPGIPSKTLENVSAVVDAATTAIININAEYGSGNIYRKLNRIISPVVAPAVGINPTNSPYKTPPINSIIF